LCEVYLSSAEEEVNLTRDGQTTKKILPEIAIEIHKP